MTEDPLASQSLFELLRSCKMGEAGAIVGGHIDRNELRQELYVPTEVDDVVNSFFVSNYQRDGHFLIITGSAGDGKSALLSRGFKNAKEHGIDSVSEDNVHMDATAATRKTESYASTLGRFLETASENLHRGVGPRSGLAINLGLAIDFFERKGNDEDFPEIWSAIESTRTKLLHEKENITVLNLGFRSIYSIHPESLGEGILGSLVDKFNASGPDSPFHQAYLRSKSSCPAGKDCPLLYNVSQLEDDQLRASLTELFAAKGIIDNEYLNPRRIIHHLASILLPSELEHTSATHDTCPIGKSVNYGREVSPEYLIWNSIFDELKSGGSPSKGMLDPAAYASKDLDLRVIELGANPKLLDDKTGELPHVNNGAIDDQIRTLLRKSYLSKDGKFDLRTAIDWTWFREEFLSSYAYLANNGEQDSHSRNALQQGARDVNRTLHDSLKGWTGSPIEGDYIEYIDGIKTPEYRFLAKWTSPEIDEERSRQRTREESMPGQMWFVLKPNTADDTIPIPLTFNLYVLMHRIAQGYSPNARDIERSEGMRLIQSRLSEFTEKQKRTRVINKAGEQLFSLERGGFGAIDVRGGDSL